MSLQIIALLIMTAAALLVGYHVFSPANKEYFNRMGHIPLDEDALPTATRPLQPEKTQPNLPEGSNNE